MSEVLINIFDIYCLINLFILYLVTPVLGVTMEDEEKSFLKTVFIYQYATYTSSINKINMLGVIILEIIVTLCTLGSNVVIFIGMSMLEIFLSICDLFYLIFKKK